MSAKTKLIEPWSSIHGAVWLIGLAILFWKGWWWPGILVLVAISAVVEAVFRSLPGTVVAVEPAPDALSAAPVASTAAGPEVESGREEPVPTPATNIHAVSELQYPVDLLPSNCPACNGPVNGDVVKWTGPRSAECLYCGANLPIELT